MREHTWGILAHTLSMHTHGLSVRAYTRLCVHTPRVSCAFIFQK